MKLVKKIVSAALFLVGALFVVLGFSFFGEDTFTAVFCLVLGGLPILVGIFLIKYKRPAAKAQQELSAAAETQQTPEAPEEPEDVRFAYGVKIPRDYRGINLAYAYDRVKIFTPGNIAGTFSLTDLEPGTAVELRQEPDNEHDPDAVAVYAGPSKIGYLYRGKLQDMTNDFIQAGWPIYAFVQVTQISTGIIKLMMGFYKPAASRGKVKAFRLTGNRSEEKQDNILGLYEGQEVEAEYDDEKDKYAVEDIGYLPKSAEQYMDLDPIISVASIDLDDGGKYVVTVELEYTE